MCVCACVCVCMCACTRSWAQGCVCEDNYFHQLLACPLPTASLCRTQGLRAFNPGAGIPALRLPPRERRTLSVCAARLGQGGSRRQESARTPRGPGFGPRDLRGVGSGGAAASGPRWAEAGASLRPRCPAADAVPAELGRGDSPSFLLARPAGPASLLPAPRERGAPERTQLAATSPPHHGGHEGQRCAEPAARRPRGFRAGPSSVERPFPPANGQKGWWAQGPGLPAAQIQHCGRTSPPATGRPGGIACLPQPPGRPAPRPRPRSRDGPGNGLPASCAPRVKGHGRLPVRPRGAAAASAGGRAASEEASRPHVAAPSGPPSAPNPGERGQKGKREGNFHMGPAGLE